VIRPRLDPLGWIRAHDPGFGALRRAGRAALVMPAMFALGDRVIANPEVATFAAFGSFAMLLLVEFGGPMRERLQAQVALALAGAVFVCLGTLVSRSPWLGALTMTVVAFGVLFAGVVSSVLASATLSLLLAFILPVSLAGPVSSIPDRLAGWGLASAASLLAIGFLWPAPERNPLRDAAVGACRALGQRLRSDAAYMRGGAGAPSETEHDDAIARVAAAVKALHHTFFSIPNRPTGLGTAARTVVRLVDEVSWVDRIVLQSPWQHPRDTPVDRRVFAVKEAAGVVLERGAELLEQRAGDPQALDAASAQMQEALAQMDEMERSSSIAAPGSDEHVDEFVSALDPGFRAQELSFAVSQIAANIDLTAAAERRSWLEQLLGRQPASLPGTLSAAQERGAAHIDRHSVWLHNSVRGAIGLGLAVLLSELTGVQHGFWVVLGALSVLRSNALNIGENALRALLGTVIGFVIGGALLVLIGTNTTLLWLLLAPAVLFAGFAPAAISFAAGQAAFTLTLLILYNIIQPVGWRVGLVRIEDIALGCGVSLLVGILFWPRGAASALGQALADAYVASAHYLGGAVAFGVSCCDSGFPTRPQPTGEAVRAAAAARRLDDAFRGYLAERGAKSMPLAGVAGLLTGVAGLRLAGDAVLDLWEADDGQDAGSRADASSALLSSTDAVVGWYDTFGASLTGLEAVPQPLERDAAAAGRLVDAVRRDLRDEDGRGTSLAVRMIWTGDHVDAARRLQAGLVEPARVAAERRALTPLAVAGRWLAMPPLPRRREPVTSLTSARDD
jgi:uncharacterized membrane protein YccC